ncbi:hypothetical protein OIU85_003610 [Salix viminalis]|uniref:Uncharacterized protein n=1 Tax=Salix viminalis TaxID=40686 RepID=A0A9Q0PZJ3_SALVM|nr:hypothetical protein OIU85_003610 [Salix viminalis]
MTFHIYFLLNPLGYNEHILSNEVTRTQYDRALKFQEHTGRSFRKRQYHNPEVEDWVRIYKWAEMKRKMRSGARWEHHNFSDDPSFYSDTEEEVEEGSLDQERGPFGETIGCWIQDWLFHCMDFGWQRWGFACSVSAICKLGLWKDEQQYGCSGGGGPLCWFKSCEVRSAPTRSSSHAFVHVC